MRWIALAGVAGCNGLFGLNPGQPPPDRVFDAPADAPPQCPTMLGQQPQFSLELHPLIDQPCTSYTTSLVANRAVAVCNSGTFVGEAAIGDPLVPIPNAPAATISLSLDAALISPEGDFLIISTFDLDATTSIFESFTRVDDAWVRGPDLPFPQFTNVSTPTRAPDRHIVSFDRSTAVELHEESPGVWTQVRSFTIDPDPSPHSHRVWLSADGLHAIATRLGDTISFAQAFYLERASIDDPFGPPQPTAVTPPTIELFIEQDCSRLYTSAVGEVFYALGR
ncbi:MAG: hypothetical protein QM831_20390 [Kofleriaceae bacterium]